MFDAQSAKPIRLVEGDLSDMDDGGARLKVRYKPSRWGRWLFRMPEGTTKTFELDAIGLMVWNLCDGTNSVQQIIRKLASRYNLNLREAEVSCMTFLRTLIRKGLLGIPVVKKKARH